MQLSDQFPAQFPLRPPIIGDWTALDREDAQLLATRLSEAGFLRAHAVIVEAMRVLPLDFYPGWLLCDVAIGPKPPADGDAADGSAQSSEPSSTLRSGIHSLLYGPDGFTALDGTSLPIHEHNMRHGIDLSEEPRRQAYFRFFCFFTRGEEGPFEIMEDGSGLVFAATADPPPTIEPPESLPIAEDGALAGAFRAHVFYARTLFAARFELQRVGIVGMVDDRPIVENVERNPPIGFEGTMRFCLKGPERSTE